MTTNAHYVYALNAPAPTTRRQPVADSTLITDTETVQWALEFLKQKLANTEDDLAEARRLIAKWADDAGSYLWRLRSIEAELAAITAERDEARATIERLQQATP